MKIIKQPRRSTLLILSIGASIFLLTRCINNADEKVQVSNNNSFAEFAGSDVCANCHKDIYDKHILTNHHFTSSLPTKKNILGSFENGKNVFAFDALRNVTMEKRDSAFYQVYYNNGEEIRKGKFDIVIGSGRKGQSYLNWEKKSLAQLPITYFSPAGQWSNSPGYPPTKIVFSRPITARCLECHSTYFKELPPSSTGRNQFDHNQILFGVECEKCHGQAASHVEFQTQNPQIKEANFIINPGKLARERMLDLCALCHGGQLTKTKPSFQFQAGDTLSNYFSSATAVINASSIDVHGNQLGLLSLSKCFLSTNMTCMSCHNIHENENGKTQLFNQRCQSCHNEKHNKQCKMTATIGPTITQNCIDCHMPKQPSHAVAVYLQGAATPTPALLRTHFIKIYPEEINKVLDLIKNQKRLPKTQNK